MLAPPTATTPSVSADRKLAPLWGSCWWRYWRTADLGWSWQKQHQPQQPPKTCLGRLSPGWSACWLTRQRSKQHSMNCTKGATAPDDELQQKTMSYSGGSVADEEDLQQMMNCSRLMVNITTYSRWLSPLIIAGLHSRCSDFRPALARFRVGVSDGRINKHRLVEERTENTRKCPFCMNLTGWSSCFFLLSQICRFSSRVS